jgi:hypothetical protein
MAKINNSPATQIDRSYSAVNLIARMKHDVEQVTRNTPRRLLGMSDVIVVLRMHRGGTSADAGVLTKLGGAAPKNQMPSNRGNP